MNKSKTLGAKISERKKNLGVFHVYLAIKESKDTVKPGLLRLIHSPRIETRIEL
jgi:hypothetical protein